MPKLHEQLAIDVSLRTQAQKLRLELQNTLDKKRHLFESKIVTMTPLAEVGDVEVRAHSDIQTSVKSEIKWLMDTVLIKAINSGYAIDHADTIAKADIILEGGTVFAKDVPATALLQLGHRLKELSELIKTIPTLDPAKGFKLDPAMEDGIYVAREIVKPSTKKAQQPLVMVQPTKEHPAQVQLVTEDIKVGVIREQEWSSLITPGIKADLLERAESLSRAVAQARSRANEAQVDAKTHKIGENIMAFVFAPLSFDKLGGPAPSGTDLTKTQTETKGETQTP